MRITSKSFIHLLFQSLLLFLLVAGVTTWLFTPTVTLATSQPKVATMTHYMKPNGTTGIVSVSLPKMKSGYSAYVLIEKDKKNYSFKLAKAENIPLPFGSGTYKVTLFQGKGDTYIPMEVKMFKANFTSLTFAKQQTILSPGKQDAQVKALIKNKFNGWEKWSPQAKVAKVHAYLTMNYQYDDELSERAGDWYLPQASRLTQGNQGICYDFASLTASLLREMGVPTRLVMGYTKNVETYHAWNEVYIDKTWKVIDTTFDVGVKKNSPYKPSTDYRKVYYRF